MTSDIVVLPLYCCCISCNSCFYQQLFKGILQNLDQSQADVRYKALSSTICIIDNQMVDLVKNYKLYAKYTIIACGDFHLLAFFCLSRLKFIVRHLLSAQKTDFALVPTNSFTSMIFLIITIMLKKLQVGFSSLRLYGYRGSLTRWGTRDYSSITQSWDSCVGSYWR